MFFSAAVVGVKCTAEVLRLVSFRLCDNVVHSAFVRCHPHLENLSFGQYMHTCGVRDTFVWACALTSHNFVFATVHTGRVSALSEDCDYLVLVC